MPQITPPPPLSDWTCVSLRPKAQHQAFRLACQSYGAKALTYSPVRLTRLPADADIHAVCQCDIVIATSPAAANIAAQSSSFNTKQSQHWYAIGPSTAKTLQHVGAVNVTYSQHDQSSEGLLNLPELQALDSLSVGLLTAPGGRGLLASTLKQRGAALHIANVYQREIITISPARLALLAQLKPPIALFCSSYEVFLAFWQQLSTSQCELLQHCRWVVSSERLKALLATHGMIEVLISHTAVPQGMLNTLILDVQGQRLR
jgi:uroporphyrinogen-III synthase